MIYFDVPKWISNMHTLHQLSFDLDLILREFDLKPMILEEAIRATFKSRQTDIPELLPIGLSEEFAKHPDKKKQWAGFLRRMALQPDIELTTVVARIRRCFESIFLK